MNRQIIAARAAQAGRGARRSTGPVSRNRPSTNLLARVQTDIPALVPVTRTRATKMTGAARCASGSGKRSLWAASQNYRTGVTVDSRWSA